MKRCLLAAITLLSLSHCKEDKVDSVATNCYPLVEELKRGEQVVDAPVVVRLSGGLVTGSMLIASNGAAWGSCNLPENLGQDSIAIYVTGYFLTSPSLEKMILRPLPFVVTAARRR